MKTPIVRLPVVLALFTLACGPKAPPTPPVEAAPPAPTPEELAAKALAEKVLGDMDQTVDPCSDFYRYACGGWLSRTEIPADKPSWTRSFSVIAEGNRAFLKDLLERAAKDPDAGDADWKKMGAYYGACMDEAGIEAAGLTGVQPLLDDIDKLKSSKDLMPLLAKLHQVEVGAFFGAAVEGDFQDPQLTILHMGQDGLGLPDRDYYLKDDEKSKELLAAYRAHIEQMFVLAGSSEADAKKMAGQVLDIEMQLARAHKPKAELRDPTKVYNKIDRAGLDKQIGAVDWGAWLAGLGGAGIKDINVESPDTLKATAKIMKSSKPDALRAYLRWHTLHAVSSHLPTAFVDASFDFFGKQVYGQQENEARGKRCVRSTDAALGEIVGKYFIEERFAGDSKDKAVGMIEGIQQAFEQQLPELDWMDETTRQRAIEKKNTLVNMIGYPDKWREYAFEVKADNHLANVLASRRFETADAVERVGKPTDPSRWFMSPPTVNAYYHPLYNHMVFPAGILQQPFFDAGYPMAMNFGGIGMVMGHELTHGFDDSGRMFDPKGRMVQWWEDAASEKFNERTACVATQFDGYQVEEGLNVNGQLTLGENIADLGGLKSAYRAFKAWEKDHPSDAPAIEGLTDDQLLFVAFAQGWCSVSSPEYLKMMVLSNPHAPPEFRVNGPVTNLPEFHEAFSCEVGKPLHPENTCTVW
jgi:putative endopeptidase